MSENDIIAKYVKERMPNILQTWDFAIFKMKEVLVECATNFAIAFKEVDFSYLKDAVERINKNADDDQ